MAEDLFSALWRGGSPALFDRGEDATEWLELDQVDWVKGT